MPPKIRRKESETALVDHNAEAAQVMTKRRKSALNSNDSVANWKRPRKKNVKNNYASGKRRRLPKRRKGRNN